MLSNNDVKKTTFGPEVASEGTPSPAISPRNSLSLADGECDDSLACLAQRAQLDLTKEHTGYSAQAEPLRVAGQFSHYGLSYACFGIQHQHDHRVAETETVELEKEVTALETTSPDIQATSLQITTPQESVASPIQRSLRKRDHLVLTLPQLPQMPRPINESTSLLAGGLCSFPQTPLSPTRPINESTSLLAGGLCSFPQTPLSPKRVNVISISSQSTASQHTPCSSTLSSVTTPQLSAFSRYIEAQEPLTSTGDASRLPQLIRLNRS